MENKGFDLRTTTGKQRPLFNIRVHCPSCDNAVIINRLFPECIYCDFLFDIDWENEFLKVSEVSQQIADSKETVIAGNQLFLNGKKI